MLIINKEDFQEKLRNCVLSVKDQVFTTLLWPRNTPHFNTWLICSASNIKRTIDHTLYVTHQELVYC